MNIELVASTNGIKTKEEALEFGRDCARVCYTDKDFGDVVQEEDKERLISDTLEKGHHSVYDHVSLNFWMKGLPKIGAILLNNEHVYSTSEKSGRFTQLKTEDVQKELYDKWLEIFEFVIRAKYPQLDEKQKGKSQKLAQENARYMTSVFTPTKMVHTLSFRQLNYIMHFFDDFVKSAPDTEFNSRLKEFMRDFNVRLAGWYEERLDPDMKRRGLSFFARRKKFQEEFGENYSTSYRMSFTGHAQSHRHRTLDYEVQPIERPSGISSFFMPEILGNDHALIRMWFDDLERVADDYPQATLLDVHECGNYKDFISKMNERLCGNAQFEIMAQTRRTLEDYLRGTKATNQEVYEELLRYSKGPKCTFPDAKCTEPCPFGPGLGIERVV